MTGPAPSNGISPARSSNTVRGIAYMMLAALAVAVLHATIRHLTLGLHAFEITFFRVFFGLVVLIPLFLRYGIEPLRTRRIGMHALRALFNVTSMLFMFSGLALTPLAKVAALDFTSPLFASLLAVLVLGERLRPWRVRALLAGFVGTLVILRPGVIALDPGALLILSGSATWAMALIVIKALSRTESSLTITLYMGILMTPIALAAAVPVWRTPSVVELGWLALAGALGTTAQFSTAQALRAADMTAVMPVTFTRLLWAALIGYLLFGEVADAWTWVGGIVIFSATFLSAYRERRGRGGAS